MSDIILAIEQLKQYFVTSHGTVKAVDGVNFFINNGETFGLVGESGSGKSTVAYTVVGMYRPTSGKITFRGQDISSESANRPLSMKKEMQIVFQDPGTSLNSARTIFQALEVPLKVHNIVRNRNESILKARQLLEMVQLPANYLYKYPTMIGGGEKQMVAIARALAADPSFIILDEPTSALDVSIQAKIINMLIDFQKDLSLSYLFITHDLSLMRNVATRVAIMYLGKLCEIALTSDFFKNPKHPYTQLLLSSISVITDEEEELKPAQIVSRGEIPSPVNVPSGCSFHLRCHRKMDICEREDPVMVEIGKGHTVRCHLYA